MVKSFYTIKDIITSKKKRQLFNIVDIKITHEEYLELNVGFSNSCEYV